MKKIKLNILHVFVITKAFLDKWFFNFKDSDELLILINGFMYDKDKESWQKDPGTFDPSVWIDWMKAVKEVLQIDSIDIDRMLIDETQAYLIMKRYVHNFGYEFNFKDIIQLFQQLDIDKNLNFKLSRIWKGWMLSVNSFLENKFAKDASLVFIDDYIVSVDQTYNMMELFLENYCLKSDDKEVLLFLQKIHSNKNDVDSIFYQNWITIYKEFCIKNSGSNISVTQAYNVMRIFLEQALCNESNQDCLKKFRVRKSDPRPRDSEMWYDWLHVAYEVLLPC